MKKSSLAFVFSLLFLALSASPALASYHGYHTRQWAPTNHITKAPVSSTVSVVVSAPTAPVITPAPVIPPPPAAVTPVVSASSLPAQAGEVRSVAYTTGYGWPDNTPAGGAISNGVLHNSAGGTGTFADPITLAVGHSIISSNDILDYPAGTKFYIPNLRKYFVVEDTCGDGSSPQNGPCHSGYQGHIWLDLWVGGQGQSSSGTLACEDSITDLHMAIQNPASNYAVASGPVYNGSCATQYGDTLVTQ